MSRRRDANWTKCYQPFYPRKEEGRRRGGGEEVEVCFCGEGKFGREVAESRVEWGE